METRQRIKTLSKLTGVRLGFVAQRLGISQALFYRRLIYDRLRKEEMEAIAEAFGVEYYSCFRHKEFGDISADSNAFDIKAALNELGITIAELGKRMNISKQAMSKRLLDDKFSPADLKHIAELIGCEYITEFTTRDGDII